MNETQQVGRYPLRRVIVIALICAAVAGGVGRWPGGAVEPVQAATLAPVATIAPVVLNGALICDGSAINRGCAMVEGDQPGPVVALGWASEAQARFNCVNGQVTFLYRRGLIVGYGCDGSAIDREVSP